MEFWDNTFGKTSSYEIINGTVVKSFLFLRELSRVNELEAEFHLSFSMLNSQKWHFVYIFIFIRPRIVWSSSRSRREEVNLWGVPRNPPATKPRGHRPTASTRTYWQPLHPSIPDPIYRISDSRNHSAVLHCQDQETGDRCGQPAMTRKLIVNHVLNFVSSLWLCASCTLFGVPDGDIRPSGHA